MSQKTDDTAERIAERGRDALLARLRPAFEQAAAAHADVLEIDAERLEEMIQRAADRADGIQWRRALAGVASEELGIGLGEALHHPAVERAQELVGAPSYEDTLANAARGRPAAAEAVAEPEMAAEPEAAEVAAEPEAVAELEAAEAVAEPEGARVVEPDAGDAHEDGDGYEEDAAEVDLSLPAVHLGGIANLEAGERKLELKFSEDGLDIIRGSNAILGRLAWEELRGLDVAAGSGRWRRRRQRSCQLMIRAAQGDASFEIPDLTVEELQARIEPLTRRL